LCGGGHTATLWTMTQLPPDALPFWDDAETFNKHFNPDFTDPENWHEAANIFPLMSDADVTDLAEDIKKKKGLDYPVAIFEGKVLDGRNRILACKRAGVKASFEIVKRTFDFDPLDFVIRRNSKRRDLTKDQRAAIAAELVIMELAKEARQRQIEAGRKHGAEGGRGKKKQKPSGQKYQNGISSAELAAKRIGRVSASYVKEVLRLERKKPGLMAKMKAGEITIQQAKKESDSPFRRGTLGEQFIVHPFTVLNAR
jgi:ParB-like chromosome segregation protein Spo0J